jgi:hypothetical protein
MPSIYSNFDYELVEVEEGKGYTGRPRFLAEANIRVV